MHTVSFFVVYLTISVHTLAGVFVCLSISVYESNICSGHECKAFGYLTHIVNKLVVSLGYSL